MAILKLKPVCKNYIWGGQRLVEEFGFECDGEICAEAWMLSCHSDGMSRIDGGNFSGKTMVDYIKMNGNDILGTNCRHLRDFPVLIKFIDARENLSVQVHPPDDYALKHEGQFGKSEMWYILEADEEAVLYCGFKKEISREEFIARIKNNSLVEILNAVSVKRGDVIFIPAGTIHAVGKGVLLAEIQQNSNVSYRIYDYGRGRPLHIDKALDVTELHCTMKTLLPAPYCPIPTPLAACDYFVVNKLNLDGKILSEAQGIVDEKSFLSVLILAGEGTISTGNEILDYRKGDSFFITADSGSWKIRGFCDVLLTTVPDAKNL